MPILGLVSNSVCVHIPLINALNAGYPPEFKGCLVVEIATNKIRVVRDIEFNEPHTHRTPGTFAQIDALLNAPNAQAPMGDPPRPRPDQPEMDVDEPTSNSRPLS